MLRLIQQVTADNQIESTKVSIRRVLPSGAKKGNVLTIVQLSIMLQVVTATGVYIGR